MECTILHGDCEQVLKSLPDNSVDSVVTDPPYGLAFMNKHWDYSVPGVGTWREVLRVLKPGGHLLSFGGTRTYHRMVVNIEDAGFEIRDQVQWIYGQGFPKSLDISKAIDRVSGDLAKRPILGKLAQPRSNINATVALGGAFQENPDKTAAASAASAASAAWEGWGTALKPANEPIVLARKPLSEKTVAANVLKWGTGGLNIDAGRIGTLDNLGGGTYSGSGSGTQVPGNNLTKSDFKQPQGRFPANVLFDSFNDPLLTLIDSAPHDIRQVIAEYFYDPIYLHTVQENHSRIPEPNQKPEEVLREALLLEGSEPEDDGRRTLSLWEETQSGSNKENAADKKGTREEVSRPESPLLEGGMDVEGLSLPEFRGPNHSRGRANKADATERPPRDSGAPAKNGGEAGQALSGGGNSSSPQWNKRRQPPDESGVTHGERTQKGTLGTDTRESSPSAQSQPPIPPIEIPKHRIPPQWLKYFKETGREILSPNCAARMLDAQSGNRPGFSGGGTKGAGYRTEYVNGEIKCKTLPAQYFNDSGGASRFFYCAKASKSERNRGLDGMPTREWKEQGFRDNETTHLSPRAGAGRTSPNANHHPTVKPIALMEYLIKLITPPNGTVLDPFMGSGSTGVAAKVLGYSFTGIERELDYIKIAEGRLK